MKYSVALLLALCSLCVASTLHQRDAASYRNHHNNHKYNYYNDDDIRENDNEHYVFKGDRVRKVDLHLIEKQQTVLHLLSNMDHNILPEHLSLLGRTFKPQENIDKFHNKNIVKEIVKSYNQKLFLPEHEVFSLSNQQHHNQAAQLFHFLYATRDWDTLKQASVWVRQRMNPHQFAYAFTAAILNHPTTRGVALPAIYEVMPNLFVPATAMHKIYKANMLGHDSATVQANYTKQNLNTEHVMNQLFESKKGNYGSHNPARVFAENDGSMKNTAGVTENMENRISYFTEDVGINAFHSGFHMQNPAFYGSHMMYNPNADFSNNLLYKNVDSMEENHDKQSFNEEYNRRIDDMSDEMDKMMDSRRCRNCHRKGDSKESENTNKDSNVWNGDDNTSDDIMTKKHHRNHKHDHHKHIDNDDNTNIWNVESLSDNVMSRNEKQHRDHHNRHHENNDDNGNSNERIWNNDDSMGNDMSDETMTRDMNRKNLHNRHHGNKDNDSNENTWNNDDNMRNDMSDETMTRDMNRKNRHNRHHGNKDNDSNENIWNNDDNMGNDMSDETMTRDMNRKNRHNRHHGNKNNDSNENIWNNDDNMRNDMSDETMTRDMNRKNRHNRHHGNKDNDSNENIWNNDDNMGNDMSDETMTRDMNRKNRHNRHHGNKDNNSNENIWNNDDNMRNDMSDETMTRDMNRKNRHNRHHGNKDNDSNENIWNNDDNMGNDMSDETMTRNMNRKNRHNRHHGNKDNNSNENIWNNDDNMRNDMSDEMMGNKKKSHVDNCDNNESLKSKILNNVGIVMDFIFRRDRSNIKQQESSKEDIGIYDYLKIEENIINDDGIDVGKIIKPKHRRNNKNSCKDNNFDGNCKNGKPVLDYIRSDNTVNEFDNKNMYIMNNMNTNDAQAVKRGESFYYAHQQLYARYVLERLSNDLPIPHPLNFNDKIKMGYNPNLQHSNGQAIPARPPNTQFHQQILENTNNINDALMPNNYQAENPQVYEKRLIEVAESGFVMNRDGSKTEMNHQNGVGILANLMAAPADSLNPDYYGDYFNTAKYAIGNIVDPNNNNGVAPGTIANLATAARDPAYYQFLAKINQIFNNLKNKFGPYTQRQLSFPGVKIEQFDVSRLITYFDTFTMNVNNALNNNLNMEDENYIIKFERLNNKPFVYKLKLNSDKSTSAVIRIFIGPKYDSNGQRFTLPQANQYFVQLDQFRVNLHRGENVVERNSVQSPNYVQDQPTFKELWSRVQNAKERKQPMDFDETESRHCGFPQRAQLPKGKPSGQKFVFYAIVTEADRQVDDSLYYNRHFQSFYCGGNNNNKMHDTKTIGYPFDRPIVDVNYNSPNQYFKTVTIYHNSNNKM